MAASAENLIEDKVTDEFDLNLIGTVSKSLRKMNFQKAEYEIQLFTFSVEQMKLENRIMVKKTVQELTSEFADSLIKKTIGSSEKVNKIRENIKPVTEKILGEFEGVFGEMDGLMERYFFIPENVLLAEDLRHEKSYTTADEEYYKAKVEEQENLLKQNAYLLAALGKELEMFEDIQPVVDREQKVSEKLDEAFQHKLNLDESRAILARVEEVVRKKENY